MDGGRAMANPRVLNEGASKHNRITIFFHTLKNYYPFVELFDGLSLLSKGTCFVIGPPTFIQEVSE